MTSTGPFSGKVALVTGGGSGIGAACAVSFAAGGASVVIADLNLAGAERVAETIRAAGGLAATVPVEVSDPASVEAMVRCAVDTYGGLDIAVSNAGIGGEQNPTGEYSLEGWQRVIGINLNGVFYSLRYELPALVARGGGAIVNIASILGTVGWPGSSAYVAAKHGVVGLTKSAALEYAPHGIRINSVGPGFIETPLLAAMDAPRRQAIGGLHALNRMGQAGEVAALVCFLASDAASFITGSYHVVDGGFTAR